MANLLVHDVFKSNGKCKKKCSACHIARLTAKALASQLAEAAVTQAQAEAQTQPAPAPQAAAQPEPAPQAAAQPEPQAAAQPEPVPDISSSDTSDANSVTSDLSSNSTFRPCGHCRNQGKPEDYWRSHTSNQCPDILNNVCNLCGETGHFPSHCEFGLKNITINKTIHYAEHWQLRKTFQYAIENDPDFKMLLEHYGALYVSKGVHMDKNRQLHYTFNFKGCHAKFHLDVNKERFGERPKEFYVGFSKRINKKKD